ncbi:ECF transporter S component [Oceanirhabdus sp. W0125-5]|uniref:ECF transporter S component n=1 Tax=Oceanirhabdus sp. W0125-5 TaxID=2999116 RepID=UPI0022F3289E|nr:ECF transporter S component [Oceanirhabdus sp. W0125-5]WBW97795.1 ECF transporter S component [Oceanirhabdus sp. W0125-5]
MKNTITEKGINNSKTLELTQMGVMIAIICVATLAIKVPTVMGIGYVHLGDSMIFLAAILFGKKRGAITAALGMTLADLIAGYAYYMPFTFVIKGIMAFIAAGIAYRGEYNGKNLLNNLFAFIIAGIWMVFGYFVAKIILVKYVLFRADSTKEAITLASASVPNNIGQFVVGIIIALFLIKLLNGRLNIVNNKKIEL